jgi:hypothetical protein
MRRLTPPAQMLVEGLGAKTDGALAGRGSALANARLFVTCETVRGCTSVPLCTRQLQEVRPCFARMSDSSSVAVRQ